MFESKETGNLLGNKLLPYGAYQNPDGTPNMANLAGVKSSLGGAKVMHTWNATQADLSKNNIHGDRIAIGTRLKFDAQGLAIAMMATARPEQMNGKPAVRISYPHITEGREIRGVTDLVFTDNQLRTLQGLTRTILERQGLLLPRQPQTEVSPQNKGLSDTEIKKLGAEAAAFIRNHPPIRVPVNFGNVKGAVESPYIPLALSEHRKSLDPTTGRSFDAHGIVKGSTAEQLTALNTLLTTGIDPNRPFHTMELRSPNENEAAVLMGAAGPYDMGAFIVLGPPNSPNKTGNRKLIGTDGIAAVLVNEHYYPAIHILQTRFPAVQFIKASEMSQRLQTLLRQAA